MTKSPRETPYLSVAIAEDSRAEPGAAGSVSRDEAHQQMMSSCDSSSGDGMLLLRKESDAAAATPLHDGAPPGAASFLRWIHKPLRFDGAPIEATGLVFVLMFSIVVQWLVMVILSKIVLLYSTELSYCTVPFGSSGNFLCENVSTRYSTLISIVHLVFPSSL